MPEPFLYNLLGTPFIELDSVDSTNNYALTQLHAGLAQHGTAFFAHEQVAGKGQRGKTWSTQKDSSLILSLVINPQLLQLTQQFHLSACIALSVCEFFGSYAGNSTCIKWPNDLYWYDRKAGGILIENIIGSKNPEDTASWLWAVIGIGVNINQVSFPGELKNPVSLKQITGKNFDPVQLAKELCSIIDKNFKQLITKGFEDIYIAYLSFLYKKNEPVKLKKGNRVFEAVIKSVLPTGELIVQHAIEEIFRFGEIEWVITTGKQEK
ncbi:MAG TPA: biotin--[acetyl-CoA-carboxylase] ligase [Chitinophagaceae bacterium]|nr:biotin--[acetyl-CoA-carboxylase] ligase [Chitinophagaceae bacterium]